MSLTLEMNEAECLLRLDGEITVNGAAELHRLLLEATSAGKDIAVAFTAPAEIDVSVIQLLFAARREMDRVGLAIRAEGDLPAHVQAAFAEVGIDPFGEPVVSGGCAWEK